jgi:hypothetical protein
MVIDVCIDGDLRWFTFVSSYWLVNMHVFTCLFLMYGDRWTRPWSSNSRMRDIDGLPKTTLWLDMHYHSLKHRCFLLPFLESSFWVSQRRGVRLGVDACVLIDSYRGWFVNIYWWLTRFSIEWVRYMTRPDLLHNASVMSRPGDMKPLFTRFLCYVHTCIT